MSPDSKIQFPIMPSYFIYGLAPICIMGMGQNKYTAIASVASLVILPSFAYSSYMMTCKQISDIALKTQK